MKQHEKMRRLRLAARISHARRIGCGISQTVLATRCRLPRQTISDIEHAFTDPDFATLRIIAAALHTTPEELDRPACTYQRVELTD